jgi:GNAT superfamily N-acetyltransferase
MKDKRPGLLELFDHDQRIDVRYPDVRREETPFVVRHVALMEGHEGMVVYSRLNADNAEAVIRAEMDHFARIGQDFEWKVYSHDQPFDLMQRLAALGFEVGDEEAIMVLDLADAPKELWGPVNADIRRISGAAGLADVIAVEQEVWGGDKSALGEFLEDALWRDPEQISIYAAYADQHPVSAAWIFFPEGSQFASLWGGSTLEAYRGRGLYTALLAFRAQAARMRGRKFLTVDASPMSRPILEKHGFIKIAVSHPCVWRKQ